MHGSRPLQLIEHVFHILNTAAQNRWLRAALNTCLGAVLVALLLRAVPAGAVLTHLQPRNLWPIFGLLALTLLSQLIRAVRWMILLRGLTRVGYFEALWVNATTQLLNFLIPVRAGEAARLGWLRRRRVSLVGRLGMVVIDHGFDLSGVALVLGTGALMRWIGVGGRLPSMPQMLVPLGLALATFGAIGLTILARTPHERQPPRKAHAAAHVARSGTSPRDRDQRSGSAIPPLGGQS